MPNVLSIQQRILTVVLALLVFGHIMLFSATGVMGATSKGSEFFYVIRQGVSALVGVLLMLALSRIRYQWWAKVSLPLLVGQIVLVGLTHVSAFSHHAQGAARWLTLGPLHFQPSELSKITLTIYAAHVVANASKWNTKAWVMHGTLVALLLGLIVKQPDLGTTVLLGVILLGMLFVAGVRIAVLAGVLIPAIAIAVIAMVSVDYRRRRLFAFLNPWADPQGSGFQVIQSFLGFHTGKIFGVGIGNGNSKLFFLPEVHTDFIFALVGEELGFIGSIGLLSVYAYLGYLLFKAATSAPDAFGKYLGFGLTLSLLFQIAVNLGGVTGLMPIKGLPLPFISWGRSALIVNLVMIGLLLNIVRQAVPPPSKK